MTSHINYDVVSHGVWRHIGNSRRIILKADAVSRHSGKPGFSSVELYGVSVLGGRVLLILWDLLLPVIFLLRKTNSGRVSSQQSTINYISALTSILQQVECRENKFGISFVYNTQSNAFKSMIKSNISLHKTQRGNWNVFKKNVWNYRHLMHESPSDAQTLIESLSQYIF